MQRRLNQAWPSKSTGRAGRRSRAATPGRSTDSVPCGDYQPTQALASPNSGGLFLKHNESLNCGRASGVTKPEKSGPTLAQTARMGHPILPLDAMGRPPRVAAAHSGGATSGMALPEKSGPTLAQNARMGHPILPLGAKGRPAEML